MKWGMPPHWTLTYWIRRFTLWQTHHRDKRQHAIIRHRATIYQRAMDDYLAGGRRKRKR